MATFLDLQNDLNDRLNDAGHSQAPSNTKKLWLNYGIRATWPKLYITARDTTLVYASAQTDYNIPAAVGNNTKILRVEIETGNATGLYNAAADFDIIPGLTDPILSFNGVGRYTAGARIRITAAKRITDLSADGDTYLGPSGSEELPVLYALGIAMSRRLDDRIDYRRMSVTQGANGIQAGDLMDASQFWFAQFELLLDRMAMPLPSSDI
jgi:hypothetical protein